MIYGEMSFIEKLSKKCVDPFLFYFIFFKSPYLENSKAQ